MSRGGAPEGGAVVPDVAQLEALLTRRFSIGLEVGRGREKFNSTSEQMTPTHLQQISNGDRPATTSRTAAWPAREVGRIRSFRRDCEPGRVSDNSGTTVARKTSSPQA